jgi:hypothetical protein
MTRNRGTAHGALIAGSRNDDDAAPDGLIKRFFQRLFAFGGRLCEVKAQIDDSRAGIDTLKDGRSKLLLRCAGHVIAIESRLGKNGANQESTAGANTRCDRTRTRG